MSTFNTSIYTNHYDYDYDYDFLYGLYRNFSLT